ncbi:hypothetical protein Tco_0108714 [Tanacetum coccineum]
MLRIKILHDVVGTSGYHCGVLRSFPVERIEQGIGNLCIFEQEDKVTLQLRLVSRAKVIENQIRQCQDSEEARITYTEVSSPFEDLSDIGSPSADDHERNYLSCLGCQRTIRGMALGPPSPDYVLA